MISYCRIRKIILSLAAALLFLIPLVIDAQSPVVYGVFFYSPTCPHCRDVISNHWPAIQNEFGDQLRVLFIDVTTQQGGQTMMNAVTALGIQANGVPMLIIGSDVLLGSNDIPALAPGVIRAGLAAGGVVLPPIPGIETLYQAALAQKVPVETQANGSAQAASSQALAQHLAADPVANGLAILILILLALSVLAAIWRFWGKSPQNKVVQSKRQHIALIFASLLGIGMSLSLLIGSKNDPTVLTLAVSEVIIFLVVLGTSFRTPLNQALPRWLVPLTAVGGFGVAGYLTFVELTLTEAVCGVVGDCNTVQQSAYARVLSVPVGVLGLAAYVVILAIWLLSRDPRFRARADDLARAVVLFGVVFSIYLTFLEPFVIGATCIWCLTSAVVMLLLLWLITPSAPQDLAF